MVSVTEKLGICYNPGEIILVKGADGASIKVLGTAYIFFCDRTSPSWRKIRLVITESRENFLLSNADLKNLSLLASNFPSYLGTMH